MKGVESLALRYVLLVLVAALVMGTVFSVMSQFTGMVSAGAENLQNITTLGMERSTAQACNSFYNCTWDETQKECRCG